MAVSEKSDKNNLLKEPAENCQSRQFRGDGRRLTFAGDQNRTVDVSRKIILLIQMLGECHSLEANKVILHIQTFLHQKHFLNPGVKYMQCMTCDPLRRQMKMWFGQHFFTKKESRHPHF